VYGLIQTAFDRNKQKSFINFYAEATSKEQMLLRQSLAQALKDCPEVIPSHGTDWMLCTLAQYEKSQDDTTRVLNALVRCLRGWTHGMLTEKIQMKPIVEIADTCIVGVGMFRDYFDYMHHRRSAPSVDYYTKLGVFAFHKTGFDDIADDFCGWTEFLEKEFTI
jgi:hypothetical protein